MKTLSLRSRMMLLFSTVVGVLLAGSFGALYVLAAREARARFDRQLLDAAAPVVSDLVSDPNDKDVNELDVPDEYFELLDPTGRVLQQSKNLKEQPLELGTAKWDLSGPVYRTLEESRRGRLRTVFIPLHTGTEIHVLLLAAPDRQTDRAMAGFRRAVLILLPLCLLVTAVISAWYVGRSLVPVAALTRHATQLAERLSRPDQQEIWMPLAVQNPHDELGRLAETFNQLFGRITSLITQLRQFVSDASHELRTPLSVLQGETEFLLSESRDIADYQKALRVIDDELKKLARIVEGLFTLAMADSGQLRLASEPLYLNEVLEEACALAGARAKVKGVVIERDLKAEVSALGDETFLRQLFLVFLDNAIKYSPPETRVRVTLTMENGMARVRFQDEGVGIPSKHMPHIFDRFYRVPQPSGGDVGSDVHGGGLGLAIAQAIANAQGGSIDCESKPGAGSTFIVSLPLHSPIRPRRVSS